MHFKEQYSKPWEHSVWGNDITSGVF